MSPSYVAGKQKPRYQDPALTPPNPCWVQHNLLLLSRVQSAKLPGAEALAWEKSTLITFPKPVAISRPVAR